MIAFTLGQPTTGADAVVTVAMPTATPLPPGPNLFDLVVVDDAGTASAPVTLEVVVAPAPAPATPPTPPQAVAGGAGGAD